MWIEGEAPEVFGSLWACVFIELYYNPARGCAPNDNIKEHPRICRCHYSARDPKKLDSRLEPMINSLKLHSERRKVSLILKNYESTRWFLTCDQILELWSLTFRTFTAKIIVLLPGGLLAKPEMDATLSSAFHTMQLHETIIRLNMSSWANQPPAWSYSKDFASKVTAMYRSVIQWIAIW